MAALLDRKNPGDQRLSLDGLLDLVHNVAKGIGDALMRPSTMTAPAFYRPLKISLVILCAETGSGTLILTIKQSGYLQKCLRELVSFLEDAISRDYVEGVFHDIEEERTKQSSITQRIFAYFGRDQSADHCPRDWSLTPYPRLQMFTELLQTPRAQTWRPHDFLSDETMIHSQLVAHIQRWNSLVDRACAANTQLADIEDVEPFKPKSPIRDISSSEVTNARGLTNAIHEILHGNWPCDSQDHNHDGRLGDCLEARFFLDPQWFSPGQVSEVFVILDGLDITQECRIWPSLDE